MSTTSGDAEDDPILSLEELTKFAADAQIATSSVHDVRCCCDDETCTFLSQNREVLRALEGRNHSAGQLGTVCAPPSFRCRMR